MEQAAFLEKAIVLLSYLVGITGTVIIIKRQGKKDKDEHDAKFATKEYVDNKDKAMKERIDVVSKSIDRNIDAIKDHFDTRIEDLKDLIKTLKKSA